MRKVLGRLLLCVVCFALAFGVTYAILLARDKKQTEVPPLPEAAQAEPEMAAPAPEMLPEAVPEQTNGRPAGVVTVPDEYPTVPYHDEAAPEGYFDDAAFLGNSLIEGLSLYTSMYDEAIDRADFYAQASMTVLGAGESVKQVRAGHYGKIYIGLGLNEIDFVREDIYDWYTAIIGALRADGDGPVIYLFSLTPVSRIKSNEGSAFTKQNVQDVSAVVKRVADDNGCFYMDLLPVLADSEGYLPAEVTTDGVHFTPEYYQNWYNYLEHNYVLP